MQGGGELHRLRSDLGSDLDLGISISDLGRNFLDLDRSWGGRIPIWIDFHSDLERNFIDPTNFDFVLERNFIDLEEFRPGRISIWIGILSIWKNFDLE